MRRVMGARPPMAPKIQMPPPPPPPAQMDTPDIAEAEMQIINAPKSEVSKAKYTKKRKGKAKGKAHSKYKGGGLQV